MLRRLVMLLLFASVASTIVAWVISTPMVENRAFARTGNADAALAAGERLWLIRCAAPVLALALWLGLLRRGRANRLDALSCEWLSATRICNTRGAVAKGRTCVFRAAIAAWLILAMVHWEAAARQVLHEWPIYGSKSGAQVLPNISETNRDVIRYVQTATPENVRILALSDQSVFFLAYYLWPREVLHRRPPESEFIIPQPDGRRPIAAYRLSDFTAAELAKLHPDYVLEYFESPQYVEEEQLYADRQWLTFIREAKGDSRHIPPFTVRLRRINDVRELQPEPADRAGSGDEN